MKILLTLLSFGLASLSYAGESCSGGTCEKPKEPACQCGAKTDADCHKHCGDKCACASHQADTPKQEAKK